MSVTDKLVRSYAAAVCPGVSSGRAWLVEEHADVLAASAKVHGSGDAVAIME